jgi:serpin B
MRKTLLITLLFAVAVAQACGDDALDHAIQRSELARTQKPQITTSELEKQVTASTNAALELFRRARVSGENTFIAPHSISSAIAMLSGAATGETRQEIEAALGFVLPQSKLHAAFNQLDLQLSSRGKGKQGADGPFRLTIDNTLWLQDGHRCEKSYLDTLASEYGAGVHMLDFAKQTEKARATINGWVAKKTEDRIPELLHKDDLTKNTLFVLTNAVYFNGGWDEPFDPQNTRMATFHAPSGDKQVSTMFDRKERALYGSTADYQAIALPYDGGELSMLVIMPGDLQAFEKGLDANALELILAGLRSTDVNLALPAFEFKKRTQLRDHLMAMGMQRAFDPFDTGAAQLPGLCEGCGHSIKVSKVIHEAFIKVNEKGAEAAGATAVVGRDSGVAMPTQPEVMTVDRPFIFLIRDHATDAVLFIGRVLDPTL